MNTSKKWFAACATGALMMSLNATGGSSPVGAAPGDDAFIVPGSTALNLGGEASVEEIACTEPGFCSAAGYYDDDVADSLLFVVTQTDGEWGDAIPVPGLEALNPGEDATVVAIACSSPGNCTIGGRAERDDDREQGFLASQVDGVWGDAFLVPGLAALTTSSDSEVNSVACDSAGLCAAVGFFEVGGEDDVAFVATTVDGVWQDATPVPGMDDLTLGGESELETVSCGGQGTCSAGGVFDSPIPTEDELPFVASFSDGAWGDAQIPAGLDALNDRDDSEIELMSCSAPGECTAVGPYIDTTGGDDQGFLVEQVGGVWGSVRSIPGLVAINEDDAQVISLSCVTPSACAIVGYYADEDDDDQAFAVAKVAGVWQDA